MYKIKYEGSKLYWNTVNKISFLVKYIDFRLRTLEIIKFYIPFFISKKKGEKFQYQHDFKPLIIELCPKVSCCSPEILDVLLGSFAVKKMDKWMEVALPYSLGASLSFFPFNTILLRTPLAFQSLLQIENNMACDSRYSGSQGQHSVLVVSLKNDSLELYHDTKITTFWTESTYKEKAFLAQNGKIHHLP